jgi:hypothetical protein
MTGEIHPDRRLGIPLPRGPDSDVDVSMNGPVLGVNFYF